MNPATSKAKLKTLQSRHNTAIDELERYKLLVENIEDYAIFMMDPDGYIQTWNKGAEKNKGYAASEIIGRHFSDFYMESDKEAKKPERELELATRYGRVEDEDWRVRKDGSKFWANVVITTLKDVDGEIIGFAKVTRNLTERKHHEDNLREANLILRKQQRDLEILNTSKDEFVSLASHQLRTPATAIKQLLGLMVEGFSGKLEPEHYEIIKQAYASNERQLEIINSLLKVAQVDAGKIIFNKKATDLLDLVQKMCKWHADTFKERKQDFIIEAPLESVPETFIDRDHIRMALDNIIDNASKYTPHGGRITASLSSSDGEAKISIQDSGVGIANEDIGKLFQRFSRISNKLSDSVGGSGLGLYWAQRVIKLHGGRIEVSSKPGVGTTFDVMLPIEGIHA